jgi:hypothetical protein
MATLAFFRHVGRKSKFHSTEPGRTSAADLTFLSLRRESSERQIQKAALAMDFCLRKSFEGTSLEHRCWQALQNIACEMIFAPGATSRWCSP